VNLTRRQYVKLALSGALAPLLGSRSPRSIAAAGTGRRLVLVELLGANDGLNTLVPQRNDHYRRLRPKLALAGADLHALQDDFAMHKALQPLADAWDNDELAWVHGLGYPAPNRSHFASTWLWESGGDGHRPGRAGWLTHDIEHLLERRVRFAHGISLVNDLSLFDSLSGRWLSLSSPEQLSTDRLPVNLAIADVNQSLAHVTARMKDLDASVTNLNSLLQNAPRGERIPGGALGKQLQQVVRFIRAGIDTPVYRVQLPGFDTHEAQLGKHERLLKRLGEALATFRQVLINDGEWSETLVMTYSEFGRRAAENLSGGTDHGTAAPHLLMGGSISGGLYGTPPDLAKLINGDPKHTLDYRSLYSAVLSDWFGIANNQFADYSNRAVAGVIKR